MGKWKVRNVHLNVVERGAGLPLLLVHGFPLDHTMWQAQIEELSCDARVVAPDLRGFGESDGGGDVVLMEDFADDLAALLDAREIRTPWCSAACRWAATSPGSSSAATGRGCGH